MGPYGTFDMAGNVSEWSWNIFGGRGLTLGGNFSDPAYSASSATPSPRFVRSSNIGFRTVRLLNPRDLNPFGDPSLSVIRTRRRLVGQTVRISHQVSPVLAIPRRKGSRSPTRASL